MSSVGPCYSNCGPSPTAAMAPGSLISRKAESWTQPRAAESDVLNEILQVTRARASPSFSSRCWAHERLNSQQGSAAPTGRSGNTRFLHPTVQSAP